MTEELIVGLQEHIKRFPDDASAREYFEMLRWNGKPVCPYCDSEKTYKLKDGRRYKCGNSKCYKIFTATVGTIFESSHIPLNVWFAAIYLISMGIISTYQLSSFLSMTQLTTWRMLNRLSELMKDEHNKATCSF